jgi:hypothetical protein
MLASRISAAVLGVCAVGLWRFAASAPILPHLTPEEARLAILAAIRDGRIGEGFSSGEEVARKVEGYPLRQDSADWWHFGVFRINPTKHGYEFEIGPADPHVRACTFFFEGNFVRIGGRWTARTPVATTIALGGGQ